LRQGRRRFLWGEKINAKKNEGSRLWAGETAHIVRAAKGCKEEKGKCAESIRRHFGGGGTLSVSEWPKGGEN